MTADEFRQVALSYPEATEVGHMGHPDFRVKGKIFATLGGPDEEWGMVKLTQQQQAVFVRLHPDMFRPVPGGWGRSGATNVRLETATEEILNEAMLTAWRNRAPKKLLEQYDER